MDDEYTELYGMFLINLRVGWLHLCIRGCGILLFTKPFHTKSYSLIKKLHILENCLRCSVTNSWEFVDADMMKFLNLSAPSHKNIGVNQSVLVLFFRCLFQQKQFACSYFAMFLFAGFYCIYRTEDADGCGL